MIRSIETEIELERIVKVKETGVKEEIISIIHQITSRRLELSTRIYNNINEVIKSDYIVIEGERYLALFGDGAKFFPTEEDIWREVDSIRKN